MRIAKIILDIPTQALDSAYSYLVPDDAVGAQVGCAALVPFGHRQAIGFIMDIQDVASADGLGVDPSKLKPFVRVLSRSYFNEDGAACAVFLAERYLAPLSSCVRLFTPPGGVPRMVRNGRFWQVEQPSVGEVDDRWAKLAPAAESYVPKKTAVKQIAILQALHAGELRVVELTAEYGAVNAALKTLEKHGAVTIEHRRRLRGFEPCSGNADSKYAAIGFEPTRKPCLTAGQTRALNAIGEARAMACGRVVVVDGVTGSGKTEVYLQAIESVIESGRTAIVLVPEISLTPQTVGRFRGRFGDLVAVMHSRMSVGERYDQWDFIRSGAARVVVGARSALFTPLCDLGLIVIDEEHEGSYKQDSAPRYVSRDVAAWMVQRTGGALVLGSATPSIEALYQVEHQDGWSSVALPERANGKPMPHIDIVDMAREFGGGSRSMFSKKLQNALRETLDAGQKAVLLLNQRGFASFVLCRACGFVPECPNCSTSLTYHEHGGKLVCHHCGYQMDTPAVCPECGSPYLRKFGAGTQRVEAELRAVVDGFPDIEADIIRMDADTTSAKGAHRKLLEEFAAADAAVLLGTQMIAKGLDFDDVTLVGVINADTQLRLPDFRAGERTFDLIEQVAGRAGRADLPGRVIVQTYWAASVPIQAAAHYDRGFFLRDELPKRKVLGYPPYVRLADILVWGKNEEEVRVQANMLFTALRARVTEAGRSSWIMLPPTPCVLTRLRGSFRYHITVKAPLSDDIAAVVAPVFRNRKTTPSVNVAVDIDPVSLL
jgi:primosomal protein N' (replication factor Y)